MAQTAPKGDYKWLMGLSDQFFAPPNHTVDIDFATTPPTATASYRPVDFWATSASMCDSSGNLLFSTNGYNVYKANDEVMENGAGLGEVGTWNNDNYPSFSMHISVRFMGRGYSRQRRSCC